MPPTPLKKLKVLNPSPVAKADEGQSYFIIICHTPKKPFRLAVVEVRLCHGTADGVSMPVRVGEHVYWVDREELFDNLASAVAAANAYFGANSKVLGDNVIKTHMLDDQALDKLTPYRVRI